MKKSLFIGLLLPFSFILNASNIDTTVNLNENTKIESKTHYISVNNTLSGGIVAIGSMLSDKIDTLTQLEKEKLEKFKKELNNHLESKSLVQRVYFNTAEYNLNDHSKNYLSNILLSLNNYKKLKYSLTGHSDSRGNEKYNLELSKKRTENVLQILLTHGVNPKNIKINYIGEKDSLEKENKENYFYDRKVEIEISK